MANRPPSVPALGLGAVHAQAEAEKKKPKTMYRSFKKSMSKGLALLTPRGSVRSTSRGSSSKDEFLAAPADSSVGGSSASTNKISDSSSSVQGPAVETLPSKAQIGEESSAATIPVPENKLAAMVASKTGAEAAKEEAADPVPSEPAIISAPALTAALNAAVAQNLDGTDGTPEEAPETPTQAESARLAEFEKVDSPMIPAGGSQVPASAESADNLAESPLKSMPYLSEMTTTAMSISPISNSPASSKDGTPRSSPTKAESPLKPASPAKAASEARIGSPKKPASPSKAASFKKEAKDASPSKKPARAVSRAKSPSKGSPKAVPVAPTAAPEADAAVAYPAGARAVEREVESPPAAVRPVVAIKAPEAEIVAEAAPVAVVVAESPSAVARTLVLSHQISAQGSMSTLQAPETAEVAVDEPKDAEPGKKGKKKALVVLGTIGSVGVGLAFILMKVLK